MSPVETPASANPATANRNVFVMTRFRESAEHLAISSAIVSTLEDYGLVAARADRDIKDDELWSNVHQCMDSAHYGVAVFDTIGGEALSPNVSLELGYMLAQRKRCLLLRETGVPLLPADLAGHLCRPFDARHAAESVPNAVRAWLGELDLAKRPDERLLIFMSSGGTCRDPMAKAITDVLLSQRDLRFRIQVQAAGMRNPSKAEVSLAAREAIRRLYGRDLLAGHVPRRITERMEQEADLIFVMSDRLRDPSQPQSQRLRS